MLNPFTTGNPFLETKLLGFSIGRGLGALKGLRSPTTLPRIFVRVVCQFTPFQHPKTPPNAIFKYFCPKTGFPAGNALTHLPSPSSAIIGIIAYPSMSVAVAARAVPPFLPLKH